MILFQQAQFLSGKTAVITGANRGIGASICENYIAHGATIIACVRNKESMPMLDDWHGKVEVVELDLADESSIKDAVKQIRTISKSIDVLVNNAGVAMGGTFQMTPLGQMKTLYDINLFGPVLFSQLLSRLMAKAKQGAIINISSSTAQSIERGTMAYGSSKAAFERITASMALELAEHGIRVNAIAPGVTDTDMGSEMDEASRALLLEKSCLKNIATPQDIANTALFLGSELSRHITGQTLHVDGGLNLY